MYLQQRNMFLEKGKILEFLFKGIPTASMQHKLYYIAFGYIDSKNIC